jgi:SAM-dependent methyltransferase
MSREPNAFPVLTVNLLESLGLENRIRFLAGTTDDLDAPESFDLITACDGIHDFASPHATLKKLHSLLKPEGVLFVIEPKVADRLEDNLNPIATMFYGFSLFHCMTQSLAAGGPGLGTCLGPERTEKLRSGLWTLREARYQEPGESILRGAALNRARRIRAHPLVEVAGSPFLQAKMVRWITQ